MFFNFIKISKRQLLRNKLYSLINVSSLVIGITAFMFMILWVRNEMIYDRHVENGESVYRILISSEGERNLVFHSGLIDNIRAYDESVDISGYNMSYYQSIKHNNDHTDLGLIIYADPNILDYFEVKMIQGNPGEVLTNPYSIVISKSAAYKTFGNQNPIGKTLEVNNKNTFTISGVFEDMPATSHIRFDLLSSFETYRKVSPNSFTNKNVYSSSFYTRINNDQQFMSINESIMQWYVAQNKIEQDYDKAENKIEFQPLYDIHMHSSDLVWDRVDRINSTYVYGSIAGGLLLLLLACFNFVNLSTAKNLTRTKEFGIRKVIGSDNKSLLLQFLGESILFVEIAFTISLILILLLLPEFNSLTGNVFNFQSFFQADILLTIAGTLLLMIIIVSIIPFFRFGKMSLVKMMRDKTFTRNGNNWLSRYFGSKQVLIVTQFVITVMICSLFQVVNSQMEYIIDKNPGYNSDNVLVLANPYGEGMFDRFTTFSNLASQIPGVSAVSSSNNIPGEGIWNYGSPHLTGQTELGDKSLGVVFIQHNYFYLLESRLLSGVNFMPVPKGNDISKVILNKSAADYYGISEAGNASLSSFWNMPGPHQIIGIVEDLYYKSLYEEVIPTIFVQLDGSATNILVRLSGSNMHTTIGKIEEAWGEAVPEWPVSYKFLDEKIEKIFEKENTILSLLEIFSLIAIFISAMGIFGLVSFTVVKKSKEIGIRKVLGASVISVMMNIMKEFFLLILAANIIALPLAYYFATSWLQNFAYSISINLILFGMAGIIALLITLLSAGLKTMHAANLPSVKAIKCE